MVDPHNNDRDVHGHSTIKDAPDRDRGGMGWLPWVLGALLLLGLLWLLTRDNDEDRVVEPVAEETLAPTATEISAQSSTLIPPSGRSAMICKVAVLPPCRRSRTSS